MRYIILSIFLSVFAAVNAQQQANAFKLNLKNGATQVIFLSDTPLLKIDGDNLKIETEKTNYLYPLADVKNYSFVTDESGINDAIADEADYTQIGDIIIIGSGNANVKYTITSVSGMTMASGEGSQCTVDISDYTPGVYLLTVNGLTSKIVKE